jgi:LacI family transcriptional regulator
MPARRATIGDVAADAGVSTATVSRVVNGATVSPATAERVRRSIARLRYTPNALTRSIFAGRSSTIGVVLRDLDTPFYLDLIRGIDEVAAAGDSLILLANTDRRADRELAHLRAMDEQRVRGLIVATGEAADDYTRRMAGDGTPCVLVARTVPDPPPGMHSITLDNAEAGRLMATHLVERGRSAIGVVTVGRRPAQLGRVDGLRRALAGFGLPLPHDAVTVARNGSEVDGALGALLARAAPMDAVVCTSGRLTVAVHAGLVRRGITVPADLGFLTMDDFPWADALGITAVAQPSYLMGRKAAELVMQDPAGSAAVVFQPALIARGSG